MSETSLSLLDELKRNPDGETWDRVVTIYSPLIRRWLVAAGLNEADDDDVVQNVLTVVFRRVSEFDRQRAGSFRKWLKTITANCLRDHWRRLRAPGQGTGDSRQLEMMRQLADPQSALSRLWDDEHDRHVTRALLRQIQHEFRPKTWEAFHRLALLGQDVDQVAADLELTVNAAFIARSRVLKRLREVSAGLLDR